MALDPYDLDGILGTAGHNASFFPPASCIYPVTRRTSSVCCKSCLLTALSTAVRSSLYYACRATSAQSTSYTRCRPSNCTRAGDDRAYPSLAKDVDTIAQAKKENWSLPCGTFTTGATVRKLRDFAQPANMYGIIYAKHSCSINLRY